MSKQPTFWASIGEHWKIARTLRSLRIYYSPGKCIGVYQCYDVCPVGCWKIDDGTRKAIFINPESCVACGACVLQCPEGAIELRK